MSNIEIKILKKDEGQQEVIETDGYLIMYIENDRIKMTGTMGLRTITPILTKLVLEKMSR